MDDQALNELEADKQILLGVVDVLKALKGLVPDFIVLDVMGRMVRRYGKACGALLNPWTSCNFEKGREAANQIPVSADFAAWVSSLEGALVLYGYL